MTDVKSKTSLDRKPVAGEEPYEAAAFARKYGIPQSEAKTIISAMAPRGANSTPTWRHGTKTVFGARNLRVSATLSGVPSDGEPR